MTRESTGGVDAHGASRSYAVRSKVMQLAVYADPRCSRRDICTAMSTARRLRQMDGSADIEDIRLPHTHRTVVEKDKSFNAQRMFARGIEATQTKLYPLMQQRHAFAFSSTIPRTRCHHTRSPKVVVHYKTRSPCTRQSYYLTLDYNQVRPPPLFGGGGGGNHRTML